MTHQRILRRLLTLVLPFAVLFLPACSTTGGNVGPRPFDVDQDVRAAFNQAMAAINAGDFVKGEEILSGLISQSRQSPVPQINLAMVRVKLGKLEGAEEALDAALAIDPMNPVANNELGLLYRKTGRFDEARVVYEKILARYPDYPAANRNLGILCDLYLRDYACAYRAYQAYSAAVPDDATAEIWLEDARRRAGM